MNKIRKYWKTAKERFKILKTVSNMLKILFETNSSFWLERTLPEVVPEIHAKIPVDVDLFATVETIDWLKNFKERWMNNPEEIEIGLKENHYFPNIKYNGKIIAYSKIGINKVYIDDFREVLSFPPKVAFLYHIYVAPEFRNKNIATFLIIKLMQELKVRGFKKIGNQIPSWNIASTNTFKHIGFKEIAYIRHYRIFGIMKFWFIKNIITGSKKLTFNISNLAIY